MQIANLEFPTKCPEQCKGKDEPWTQGGLCSRCPIFNVPELVSADSYNPTWAAEFHAFINGGPEPTLRFDIVESDELVVGMDFGSPEGDFAVEHHNFL